MNNNNQQKPETIPSINPATGELLREYPQMSGDEISRIIERADQTYHQWKLTPFEKRAALLNKVASLMEERQNELARLCSLEMGKLFTQGLPEIQVCISIFRYYAINGAKILADQPLETPVGRAFMAYEPLGVLLSIQPWNFPFYQVSRSCAPHIMAGNTYVLKHASIVPQCAEAMQQLFRDAGAPEGVFSNIFIPGSESDGIIRNEKIRGVCFTGSESAGKTIAQTAGEVVKKCVLELGGSDPFIVLEDADVDSAVQQAAFGRLANNGQICTSPKRIIILDSMAEEFITKTKAIYENIKVGDPLDPQTQLGPLSSADAVEKVLKQVDDTVKAGAQLVFGGKRIASPGAFMQPTILTGIQPGMSAYSEEIFGPVLAIYVVKDTRQAIDLANDTKFGLGATIISQDEQKAIAVARQIESGMVFINHVTTSMAELPFGGVKNSGFGRELSVEGIKEFVNHKLIRISSPEAPY